MRTALVTGGAKRIGASIVDHLRRSGWNVIVHYFASQRPDENSVKADFNDPGEIKNMLAQLPAIDLIINNASIFEDDSSKLSFDRHMQINYEAPVQIAEHYRHTNTCIINILDAWATNAKSKNFQNYIASKRKLAKYTSTPNPTLSRVNAIELGVVLHKEGQDKVAFDKLKQKFPTSVDDIFQVIDYIISDNNVRGEIINIPKWKLVHSAN